MLAQLKESDEPHENVFSLYLKELYHFPILPSQQAFYLARRLEDNYQLLIREIAREKSGLSLLEQKIGHKAGVQELALFVTLKKDIYRQNGRGEELIRQLFDLIYFRTNQEQENNQFSRVYRKELYQAGAELARRKTTGKKRAQKISMILRSIDKDKARFVEGNLRLVIYTAKNYKNRGLSLADLVQEGNMGLIQAVDRFDYRMGYHFSTYASWWVRHHLHRAIEEKSRIIRIPTHFYEQIRRYSSISKEMSASGEKPTHEEILAVLADHILGEESSPKKIEKWIRSHSVQYHESMTALNILSLDAPVKDREEGSIADLIRSETTSPEDSVIYADIIKKILEGLDPRERDIIIKRFGLDGNEEKTLIEIGEAYQVSKERIRQVEETTLKKIRRKMKTGHPNRTVEANGSR